jgi:hypothetical protein
MQLTAGPPPRYGSTKVSLSSTSGGDVPDDVLAALSAERVAQYDTYTIVRTPTSNVDTLIADASRRSLDAEAIDDWDVVTMPSGRRVDTRETPSGPLLSGESVLYVIQMSSSPGEGWINQVRSAGAETISYLPSNAFLLRANRVAAEQVANLAFVQWIAPYAWQDKFRPADLSLARADADYIVQFTNTASSLSAISELAARSGFEPVAALTFVNVRTRLTGAEAFDLLDRADVIGLERAATLGFSGEREALALSGLSRSKAVQTLTIRPDSCVAVARHRAARVGVV